MGRAGRDGSRSVCVFIRKKGEHTPKDMKALLEQTFPGKLICPQKGITDIFTLSNPDSKSGKGLKKNQYNQLI